MSLAKVLLLSCILMMHVSFMASRPVELNKLRENLRKITIPCQDLRSVEINYTREMFPTQAPSGLNSLAKEISLGNTAKEINSSICAISKYLGNHIGDIVNDTLESPMKKKILDIIEMFTTEFKKATEVLAVQCDMTSLLSLNELHGFEKKELGCQILSSVRQWMEHFSHKSCRKSVKV